MKAFEVIYRWNLMSQATTVIHAVSEAEARRIACDMGLTVLAVRQ